MRLQLIEFAVATAETVGKFVLYYQKKKEQRNKKKYNQKCATRLGKWKKNVTLKNAAVFKFLSPAKLAKTIGGVFFLFTPKKRKYRKIAEKYICNKDNKSFVTTYDIRFGDQFLICLAIAERCEMERWLD